MFDMEYQLPPSYDPFQNYHWHAQMTAFRKAELSRDASLDALLKKDPSDVLAHLCHDALFKGNARIQLVRRLPLIRALAHLSEGKSIYGIKRLSRIHIHGHEPLVNRLKRAVNQLPNVGAQIEAEVTVHLIINFKEYFAVLSDASSQELYGVIRIGLTS